MLCERFGDAGILMAPEDMKVPYMASLRLPKALQGDRTKAHCERVLKVLMNEYKISILLEPVNGGRDVLMRISANIYNTKDDYQRLADALTDLINNPSKLTN